MSSSDRGFTLIELLIVFAIIGVALGIVLSSFFSLNERQVLEKETNAIKGLLEQARMNTVSSRSDYSYGVHLASSSTTLFKCPSSPCVYLASDGGNVTRALDSRLTLSYNLSRGSADIIFSRITGATSATGTIVVVAKNNASSTKTITIYGTGVVNSN